MFVINIGLKWEASELDLKWDYYYYVWIIYVHIAVTVAMVLGMVFDGTNLWLSLSMVCHAWRITSPRVNPNVEAIDPHGFDLWGVSANCVEIK